MHIVDRKVPGVRSWASCSRPVCEMSSWKVLRLAPSSKPYGAAAAPRPSPGR